MPSVKKFKPSLHPRDRFGRFTHSGSEKASPAELKSAQEVAAGLKPKRDIVGDKAPAYLASFAPEKGRAAVAAYSNGGYVKTHKALRAGKTDSPEVKAMDAAMIALPDDLVLSRRVPLAVFGKVDPASLVGLRVRDASYAPTSIGTVRATKKHVRMRIAAPKGTRAAVHPDTGEVILDRDMDMVVSKVEKTATGIDMYVTVLPKQGGLAKSPAVAEKPQTQPAPAPAPAKKAAPKPEPDPDDEGPDDEDVAQLKADLMKKKVVELKAMMKERGLKPGKLLKAGLVDALVADETGNDKPKVPSAVPKSAPAGLAPKATPAVSPAEQVAAGDFSGLRRVGPQGGSNPGGVFEAADGSRWYVKAQKSREHAANEALASVLYREAGIDAPEVVRGAGAPGVPGDQQTASRIIDGATPDLAARLSDPAYVAQVRAGFGVDAWLANWDVAGLALDNIVTGGDGKPYRIDTGGALLFRAQGAPRGAAFGPEVHEWGSLRDPATAPQASRLFAGMSHDEQITAIERVEAIDPDRVRQLASDAGLPAVGEILAARREHLLSLLPGLRAGSESRKRFAEALSSALEGQAALDAVPVRAKGSKLPGIDGWDATRVRDAESAIYSYQGSGYERINGYLRGQDPANAITVKEIKSLDDLMGVSVLESDLVSYRGWGAVPASLKPHWNDTDLVGLEWTDGAYGSTSADRRVAENFAGSYGSQQVLMRTVLRKGMSAVRLSDMAAPAKQPSGINEEAEMLIARGAKYKVVADHGFDALKRRIIDVEVMYE